ncbi:DJ-1/PfpI family protein [Iamia sp. SCSIO 61187]|uniref:DJ-1/PfpI family protein n=1 Tax=Iamia sp. SCSIO 61187 TaxID=2722752 RepID=UPI001C633901|nr:DJ-1/PfpI family protein [Iamia sp. SCSIO 61187]QYG93981.1 DJ-1/PfpI family protein [Iamia sp. SCSIO 61187]
MTKTIGILLFDGVEELDAVGPWEVLAAWCAFWPDDGWRVTTFTVDGGPVTAAKGLPMVPHHGAADVGAMEIVLHPGGQGTRPLLKDPDHLDRVRAWAAAAEITTSVCTGSLVYAAAGLLAGRPATTHWGSLDTLAELDPTIEVRPDDRYVDDGDVITSAGVSAGIDMALALVARLATPERSAEVRRYIQYDPAPPH